MVKKTNKKPIEAKQLILTYLKAGTASPKTVTEIANGVGLSYATASKWVEVLLAEGKIKVRDYGNVKLVEPNDN